MDSSFELLAVQLAEKPTESTQMMGIEDRRNGIRQMLMDLNCLARIDGCIAAAWALEYIKEYGVNESDVRVYSMAETFSDVDDEGKSAIGKYYNMFYICDDDAYLHKDGELGYSTDMDNGYWETKEQAEAFLADWLKNG